MALTKVQTTLWMQTIVQNYLEKGIMAPLCNRNLKQTGANAWKIVAAVAGTAEDVDDTSDITYQALEDSSTDMTVNFDKHVPQIDLDTDRMSTDIQYLMAFMNESAATLTSALDAAVLGNYGDAGYDSYETGSTAWQFTKDTCAEVPGFFAKLTNQAKTANWPDAKDKILIGPAGLEEAILTYSGGRATTFGDQVINGRKVMDFMGWKVMFSNQCTTVSTTVHGLAFPMQDSIAMAIQSDLASVESMRAEGRHGTLYRPRLRAAHKVYRSEGLIDVNFNSTTVATS